MNNQSKRLLLVDLDGTLLRGNSLPLFLINALGWWKLILGIPMLLVRWMGVVTQKGLLSGKLKEALFAQYFQGKNRVDLEAMGEKCVGDILFLKLNPEVERPIREALKNVDTVVLVTASLDVWVKPFALELGIPYLCTEVEYGKNDRFTGRFATPNCKYGEKKKRILKKFDVEKYSRVVAFGNSSGDAAMFELADEVWWVEKNGSLVCLKTAE